MKEPKKDGVTVFKCGKQNEKSKPKKNKKEAATASKIIMEDNYGD